MRSSDLDHQRFDHTDNTGTFDSSQNAFIVYQDNGNIAVPSVITNPFDDNFSSGNNQADAPDGKTRTNPFDSACTIGGTDTGAVIRDRNSMSKSHFRSRSDTFSDLALRSSGNVGSDSNQLLSVNETGSPHKSSPDIRMEQNEDSFKEKKLNLNGHSRMVGEINVQGFSELYPKKGDNDEHTPKLLLDIGKSTIERKLNTDLGSSDSELVVPMREKREAAKGENFTKSNDSKNEKPTLEEADESPLISPSSSVQERRYVYVRTSSCSSDEVSEKSKHDSSEDEADGTDDRVDYGGIGSSSSSLEAEMDNCGIKGPEEQDVDEDVFGSAPFHIDTKKQSMAKRGIQSIPAHEKKGLTSRNEGMKSSPDGLKKVPSSSHGIDPSGVTKNAFSNPFGMDPFTVPVKSEPRKCKGATPSTIELKVNENTVSRSPTSEDPFGHAPFVKIVKHKRPLSSQELAEKKEAERKSHPRIHQRRRMLPRTPVQE